MRYFLWLLLANVLSKPILGLAGVPLALFFWKIYDLYFKKITKNSSNIQVLTNYHFASEDEKLVPRHMISGVTNDQ